MDGRTDRMDRIMQTRTDEGHFYSPPLSTSGDKQQTQFNIKIFGNKCSHFNPIALLSATGLKGVHCLYIAILTRDYLHPQ